MKRKVKWRKKSRVKTAAAIGCALLIAGAVSAFACVHFELQSYNTIQAGSEKREEAYITNSENALDYPFYLSLYGGKLAKDQKVIILAEKSGWVKIMYSENGKLKTGFVKKDSLRDIGEEKISAQSIELDRNSITAKAGESIELNARVFPFNSTDPVQITSSDESVAKVQDGKICILKSGNAQITVTAGKCSKVLKITAIETEENFAFEEPSYTLNTGESLDLSKKLKSKSTKVQWETSDQKTVSVKNGIIKAESAGAAIIPPRPNGTWKNCLI